ncbi:protein, SNF2 family [Oesophagostomum dentatum]|uniref:SWI/SNF-related matrix-associated actin-dependent regulator of chromatin subfamily A containing DEAD/H box 1 homolog n=1 Tax=Oesophagostomum dentatum TaxID=61180 RepID=A0A0B1TEA5_OESDE|nr:protein, SNF2 family [Oesophagostomum dentatum]
MVGINFADISLLFRLLVLCIPGFLVLSQKEKHTWPVFSLTNELKTLLLRFFYCIMAFDVNSAEEIEQICAYIKDSKKVFTYGMSSEEFVMIVEKIVDKKFSLVQVKLAIIKLLFSGLFEDEAVFSILVLATAQSIEAVSGAAETAMKKVDINSLVDKRVIVDELMASYLGITTPTRPVIGKITTVSPVCSAMKQKILQYLARSNVAPVAYMNNMKVCLDGLTHTSRTESKLLIATLNFLVKVIEQMPTAAQKNFGPLLFERVQKLQETVTNGVALSLMYRCLGILGKRDSSILTGQADTIGLTFKSIAEDYIFLIIFIYFSRDEICNEATRLLDISLQVDVSVELVVLYLWDHLKSDIVDSETGKEKSPPTQTVPPAVYQMCSRYLWAILGRSAGAHVEIRATESGHEWIELSPKITKLMQRLSTSVQERLTTISLKALKDANDVHLFHIAACFSTVCSPTSPMPSAVSACLNRARGTTRSELANVASHLAARLLSEKEKEQMMSSVFGAFDKANVTAGDCWLISAFAVSYALSMPVVTSTINKLVNIADEGYSKPSSVLESALGALSNILRCILRQNENFELSADDLDRLVSVCEKIAVSRKDAISTKAHEEATRVIGFSATKLADDLYEKLTTSLYAIGNGPPQPEVQLIVGSALYDVAMGPHTCSRRNLYLTAEEDIELGSLPNDVRAICEHRLSQIFLKIFGKLPSTNHHERRSALIWLFVVVRKCFKAKAKVLQGMLDKIQSAFGMGLAENDASFDLIFFVVCRYRYDPDLKVRQSMRSIWSVLTGTKRGIVPLTARRLLKFLQVDEYADEIAKELKQQLTHREWRVRESSCLALSDLVQGTDTPYIRSIAADLMLTVFRLRDDIKESVRLAANRAVASIGKLVLRLSSESSKGHDPHAFLESFLPVLIRNGIHSDTKVNKQFSISLLLELSKASGAQLRPFLAELIPSLIDAISDSEPAILNYVAARSSLEQLEALDDARSQIARTSPIMTAIHDLIPQVDSSVLIGVQPRLCEQLRSSAGATTRTACAQLLTVLALRAPQLLLDHPAQCDKFFNALIAGTRDRNPSVRKHFASALSYLAKYASTSCFEVLMRSIAKDLLGDDESMKQSVRHVLKSLSANCPELLQGYSKLIVPYIFLEKCQPVIRGDEASKKRNEEWCELWNEIVPSTEAAVRLYRQEILSFTLDILHNNDVWSVRAQAARMLTETMGSLKDRLDGKEAASLLASLMPLLSGRIWTGKEYLLNAVAATFNCAGKSLQQSWTDKELNEAFATLTSQASKKKKRYASAGLLACSAFARGLSYPRAADWLFGKVEENTRKALDPNDSDDQSEGEESSATKETKMAEFLSQNMIALTQAAAAYSEVKDALKAMDRLSVYLTSQTLFWKAKQALAVGLIELVESWKLQSSIESTKLVDALLTMGGEMLEQQRKTIAVQSLAGRQMSSSKFGDEGRSRVAHRSTNASDEMLQSLQHKRLALAKIAATIGSKSSGQTRMTNFYGKQYTNGNARGPAPKRKKVVESDDEEDFIVDDEEEEADEDFVLSDEEEERARKKRKSKKPDESKSNAKKPSADTVGLEESRSTNKKTRTLSESSEEEWLCKPRLNESARRMSTRVSDDTPIKKTPRKQTVLSDESEEEPDDRFTSAPTLKKVAKAAAKHARKRKVSSDYEEFLEDGSERGSDRLSEQSESADSDDEDHRYRSEEEDDVMLACLDFFNTATRPQVLSTPRFTERIAAKILDGRPFATFRDLEVAVSEVPRGTMALNAYMETLENRGVLEKILDDCKSHAQAVASEFEQCTEQRLQPKLLDSKCSLHEYQHVGLNWLVMMYRKGFNCILGDEMGLGKTIQVIAFIAYLKEIGVRGPHLIVVPSSTIENWMSEFLKWCPKIHLLTYYGSQDERKQLRHMAKKRKENIDVVLTTYNMISSKHDDKKFFKNFSMNYVIYDEGHMLKNCGTDRYRNLMKVKGKRKILMTGTPLQNNLIELISLMYFVMTNIFTKYCEDIGQLLQHFKQQGPALESGTCSMYQKDRIEQAKQILQPYILRRLKTQVLGHLPEKHEEVVEVDMLQEQKELYENVLDSVKGFDGDTSNAYGALIHLRQAANHPLLRRVQYTDSLVDKLAKTLCAKEKPYEKKRWEDVAEDLSYQSDFQIHQTCEKFRSTKKFLLSEDLALESGKCKMLDKLLPKIIDKGDKVLIFSQFTSMLDILEVYMRIRKYKYKRLDGSTPVMERQEMINEFNNDDDLFVFLLSTRAGGLGINLTSANHIILHDIDFNPYNDKQAEDRCHRMGQKKEVYVTRLISKDTVEVDIHCLARKKLQLEKAVTDGIKGQLEEIDENSRASGSLESKEEKPDSDTLNLLLSSALKRKSTG